MLKNECLQPDYLKSKGLDAQDLQANLNVLVAGDDSGLSQDLTHIGLRPLRLNIVPHSKSISMSDNFGAEVPRFATTYSVDVDWGNVHIRPSGDRTKIDLSFLASNFSDPSCFGTHCTRSSNYIQPVFGQVEIFELKKNLRPELKEEWWDGGFADPNWQGFITGMGFTSSEAIFTPGRKYRMQVTFQDPTDDYAIYLSGLNQMLVNLANIEGGTVGVDTLPALSVLQQLGVFPSMSGTSGLRRDDQPVNLAEISKGLNGIIANRIWPTYYGDICDPQKSSCLKLGKQKFYQKLTLEFTAGEVDTDSGELTLNDVSLQKESTVFKSYSLAPRGFPTISCGGEE